MVRCTKCGKDGAKLRKSWKMAPPSKTGETFELTIGLFDCPKCKKSFKVGLDKQTISQVTFDLKEDVMLHYQDVIANFDDNQQMKWGLWRAHLPQRVTQVRDEHKKATKKVGFWKTLNYLFVILSAAVPIIVSILVNVFSWPFLAQLLDVVFPVLAGIVQKILSGWSKRRQAFAQVDFPYATLLADIIGDIHDNKYSREAHAMHRRKVNELNSKICEYL